MNAAEFRTLSRSRANRLVGYARSATGARRVTDELHRLVDAWGTGEFDWRAWDAAVGQSRAGFAGLVGASSSDVATVRSLAEAVATVVNSLPRTRVVLPAEEFRGALSP